MICPVVSKEHFRSMRITLAFSVIALSFCIAFAVLTFAGILAQYTALCAAFFALVSSGLFLLYRFISAVCTANLNPKTSFASVWTVKSPLPKRVLPNFTAAWIALPSPTLKRQ